MATVLTMPKLERHQNVNADADRQPPRIIDVLAKLHIIPFTAASVKAYMEAHLRESLKTPPVITRTNRQTGEQQKYRLDQHNIQNLNVNATYGHSVWINPLGATETNDYLLQISRCWETLGVADYEAKGGKIPEQVRDTMARVTAEAPNAVLEVAALSDPESRFYDPFLIVRDQNYNCYFIEVWDEAGYKVV